MGSPVLIVNDDDDTREGLRQILELDGFRVVGARNGHEALQLLHGGLRPCIIIFDLMMPVMNGFEFRREQLRHSALCNIPVLAHSGLRDVRQYAQDLKANDYIELPLEISRISAAVKQHCLKE